MRNQALTVAAALALSGCATIIHLPVTGETQDTHEEFSGTATSNLSDGSGQLNIVSLKGGVSCEGNFVMMTARQGQGVLKCSDKRTGPFQFASTGVRGTGTGTLGGERFTFVFGR